LAIAAAAFSMSEKLLIAPSSFRTVISVLMC
jgi:hypothetical protein